MKNIKINNKEYTGTFEHLLNIKLDGLSAIVEHLKIEIDGEIETKRSKIHIEYDGVLFFGSKVFPYCEDDKTTFLVYIFQEGDSEL